MRAVALLTGGLDSRLAVRLVQEQGIEVIGLHVATPLCATDRAAAEEGATALGIGLKVVQLDESYCDLVRRPKFGRIKNSAPCLDCRIAVWRAAREGMRDVAADFVISGEVVGQRIRTAIRDLEIVAHHAGLEELLVRPLSARLLPVTQVEQRGWVDRGRLLAFHGKGRRSQERLAEGLAIDPLPPPRPQCPLLGEVLGQRLRDLLDSRRAVTRWELALLRVGRHFRLDDQTRAVVGHDREENEWLAQHALQAETPAWAIAQPSGFVGPTALIIGDVGPVSCDLTARLVARLGRIAEEGTVQVAIGGPAGEQLWEVAVEQHSPAPASGQP